MKTKITFPSAKTVMGQMRAVLCMAAIVMAICVGADVLAKNVVAALLVLF